MAIRTLPPRFVLLTLNNNGDYAIKWMGDGKFKVACWECSLTYVPGKHAEWDFKRNGHNVRFMEEDLTGEGRIRLQDLLKASFY